MAVFVDTITAYDSESNWARKTSYPPVMPGDYMDADTGSTVYTYRSYSGGNYTIDVGYVNFNLEALDPGLTVTEAKLRLYVKAKSDSDSRYGPRAEYYTFPGSSSAADWVAQVTNPCTAPKLLSTISTDQYAELDVTDLTGITLGSVMGFRLTMYTDGTAAPSSNNGIEIVSHSGTQKPQLVITSNDDAPPDPGPGGSHQNLLMMATYINQLSGL